MMYDKILVNSYKARYCYDRYKKAENYTIMIQLWYKSYHKYKNKAKLLKLAMLMNKRTS